MPLLKLKETAKNAIDKGRDYTAFDGEHIAKYIFHSGDAPDLGCFEFVIDTPDQLAGDVNEDGAIDISDIVAVINQMAGIATWRYADVNSDNDVNISDVVSVINIIAGK